MVGKHRSKGFPDEEGIETKPQVRGRPPRKRSKVFPDEEGIVVTFDDCPSTGGGWCFEDFTELSKAVHSLLTLLNESGFHDREMMIDFTGGNKVPSVVAAAMTLNRPVKAQYVKTEEPWSVQSYSVVTAPEMGPGT